MLNSTFTPNFAGNLAVTKRAAVGFPVISFRHLFSKRRHNSWSDCLWSMTDRRSLNPDFRSLIPDCVHSGWSSDVIRFSPSADGRRFAGESEAVKKSQLMHLMPFSVESLQFAPMTVRTMLPVARSWGVLDVEVNGIFSTVWALHLAVRYVRLDRRVTSKSIEIGSTSAWQLSQSVLIAVIPIRRARVKFEWTSFLTFLSSGVFIIIS